MIAQSRLTENSILHVGRRSAFVDFALARFNSVAPGRNALLVFGGSSDAEARHPSGIPTHWAGERLRGVLGQRARIRAAGAIVVHGLSPLAAVVILLARWRTAVLWSGWGDDYYGGFWDARRDLTGEKTSRVVHGSRPWLDRVATIAKRARHSVLRRAAARRVDFFSAPIEADLAVMSRNYRGFRGTYLQINYASTAGLHDGVTPVSVIGDVMVGNSAAPTNNLLEVLAEISMLDLGGRRVIVPLGYGHAGYRRAVVEKGEFLFGGSFVPLQSFLALDTYREIARGCDIVIMNHWRQQAVGNVIFSLYFGSRIVFDRRNPLFAFCLEAGLSVFSMEDLQRTDFFTRPPAIDIEAQRSALARIWGDDVVNENFSLAVSALDQIRASRI